MFKRVFDGNKLDSKKLVQLSFVEPKGVICDWGLSEKEEAGRDFFVPSYIIVGVFDDGLIKAAGIRSLEEINEYFFYEDLFSSDEFKNYVGTNLAKAYVAGRMENEGWSEAEAKHDVLVDLEKAGIYIAKEARVWLCSV